MSFGRHCPPLVCISGWPNTAVIHLLRRLSDDGASLRHHGDFDGEGIRIAVEEVVADLLLDDLAEYRHGWNDRLFDGPRAITSASASSTSTFDTQRRTPKASYGWYRDLIAGHRARRSGWSVSGRCGWFSRVLGAVPPS
ncbi:DUF2399 domain-containing protein [Kitasatospora sp. NPDC127067]|uniref:DUF2399 domain-containing protein n=1 Tax=Kitasatospora sp. NPDC127067 TaxID=3347126 RepID=UPI003663E898